MPHYRILLHRPLTCLSHRCALAVLGNAFLKHLRTTDYLWQIFCMGFVFLKTVPETPRHRVLPRRPCADPSSASLRVGGARERVLGRALARQSRSRSSFRAVKQSFFDALFYCKNAIFYLLQPLYNQWIEFFYHLQASLLITPTPSARPRKIPFKRGTVDSGMCISLAASFSTPRSLCASMRLEIPLELIN